MCGSLDAYRRPTWIIAGAPGGADGVASVEQVMLSDAGVMEMVAALNVPPQPSVGLRPLEMSELLQRLEGVAG